MSGYLYRIYPADGNRLRTLVRELVGLPCWSFGGAARWDLTPALEQVNLRAIRKLNTVDDLDLRGDFGHAFAKPAEIRWKRRTTTSYDVLVLSEQQLIIPNMEVLAEQWRTSTSDRRKVLQEGDRPALSFIAYHAPNGAVQFLRYTEV